MARAPTIGVGASVQICATQVILISQEDVVLKSSLFDRAIRESHFSIAMLDPLFPLSLVDGSVCPEHLTVPLSLVLNVAALVDVAALPSKDTISVLPILGIFSIILVARCDILLLLPLAFPVFEALLELAHIDTPRLPLILTLPIWLALFVRARVCVPVRE